MKGTSLRPIAPPPRAPGWLIGSALLLAAAAGPILAAASISGTVTAPAGRSAAGAQVNATDSQFRAFRATVEEDGSYLIEDLEPGTYTLVVVGKGTETEVLKDVVLNDGDELQRDFTLKEAVPFCIVKSPNPIPLTDDYYSAAFADAPEIRVDEPWQIVLGVGTGDLESWNPTEVSGKFKLKYSDQALHLAADLTLKNPGAHNWPDSGAEIWDGNAIDFNLQNDAYDPNRAEYDLDHNWQIVVGLGETPVWKLFQRGVPPEHQNPPKENAKDHVLRKVKADNSGELVRIDFPWSLFQQNQSKKGPIPVPQDNQLAAIDLSIGGSDPDLSREEAQLKNRLSWSGFFTNWQNPGVLRPARFCPQAP